MPGEIEIAFTLNALPARTQAPPAMPAAVLLRDRLNLPGTKIGCGEGECGACTILLDGESVNSCLLPAALLTGRDVVTIEGLEGPEGRLHPVQQAFVDAGAVQCGYCTPGMVIRTVAFLRKSPDPTDAEIARSIEGNLCRCTGYVKIHDAIRAAARALAAGPDGAEAAPAATRAGPPRRAGAPAAGPAGRAP